MRGHVKAIESIVRGLKEKDAPKEIQDRMKARLKQAKNDLQITIEKETSEAH